MRLVNIVLLELLVVLGAPPVAVVFSFNCSYGLYCEQVIQRLRGAGSDSEWQVVVVTVCGVVWCVCGVVWCGVVCVV